MKDNIVKRCSWGTSDEEYQRYHDLEWGVPVIKSNLLFANLCLETQQSGLSWLTVLKKRSNYYSYCLIKEPEKLAKFTTGDIENWLNNPGLIRHRRKLQSLIINARAYVLYDTSAEAFSNLIWQYQCDDNCDEVTICRNVDALCRKLKQIGFVYIGTATIRSFMEATGVVSAHQPQCYKFQKTSDPIKWNE